MKKRILFLATSKDKLSGGQTMILNLLKMINKDRFTVEIALQKQCPLSIEAEENNIKVHYIPYTKFFSRIDNLKNKAIKKPLFTMIGMLSSPLYTRKLKRENYDIVWCENLTMLLLSSYLKFNQTKIVYNMWSTIKSISALKLISILSNYIVVEAGFQKEMFSNVGRVSNIQIINTQINKKVFSNEYTKSTAKEKMKFPCEKIVIGFLGGCRYSKGYDILVDIAYEIIINRDIKNVLFYIGGKTKFDDLINDSEINSKVEAMSENIIYSNWIENKELFYKSIDVFISASRSEGLPGTIREAMGFGIPVVATDVGGSYEVIGNEELLVPMTDNGEIVIRFAQIIEKIMNSNFYAECISKQGKERANSLFIGDKWIRDLEQVFKDL